MTAPTPAGPATPFAGPLFVVGMPRSGTKLLRALLDRHPRIGFAMAESQFLPYLVTHRDSFGDLARPAVFAEFYAHMLRLPYFVYMREQGPGVIDCDVWHAACADYSPAGLFEALLRHDTGAPAGSGKIWGDKCPSYIIHTPLLRRLFPGLRIVHIVRDVRDYALSCNKAWGKNMLRAAQRWTKRIEKFANDNAAHCDQVHTIRYEDMLADPERELRAICEFVGVEFDAAMLTLAQPSENLGDTRGESRIVATNLGKYRDRMSAATRRRIESVAAAVLTRYGYEHDHTGPVRRLGRLRMNGYRLLDGLNLLRFEARQRPLLEALSFQWRLFRTSGNRRWRRTGSK